MYYIWHRKSKYLRLASWARDKTSSDAILYLWFIVCTFGPRRWCGHISYYKGIRKDSQRFWRTLKRRSHSAAVMLLFEWQVRKIIVKNVVNKWLKTKIPPKIYLSNFWFCFFNLFNNLYQHCKEWKRIYECVYSSRLWLPEISTAL